MDIIRIMDTIRIMGMGIIILMVITLMDTVITLMAMDIILMGITTGGIMTLIIG